MNLQRVVVCCLVALLGTALFTAQPLPLHAAPARQYQGVVTSPTSGQTVRGAVAIVGTATHPEFWKYELRIAAGTYPVVPDEQWYRLVVREQSVTGGQLGVWDTSALADGPYTIRLRVVRADGQWQDFDVAPLYVSNAPPTQPPPPPPTFTPIPPTATSVPPTATTVPATPTPAASPTEDTTPTASPTGVPTLTSVAAGTPLPTLTAGGVLATLTPLGGAAATAVASNTPISVEAPTAASATPDAIALASDDSSNDGSSDQTTESGEAAAPAATTVAGPAVADTYEGPFDRTALLGSILMGAALTVGVALLIGLLYLVRNLVSLFRA
ncbi:MAG: hypothetical protein KDD73_11990 [Anaerolineales bacterium]|nr:hypothetical protein [Anaerolineales bacterium]